MNSPARYLVAFALLTTVFSLVLCQAPLYYSNQNQYFLHGLANAGEGDLSNDWLAQTRDPTPVFSALVEATARWLHPWAFHLYYALLQGAYAAAMLAIFFFLAGPEMARRRWPLFLALFALVHAALLRWASYQVLKQDYPWFFQAGVAGQYILGAMFQPSSFGILLVVAIAFVVHGRIYGAGISVALAVTFHSTYLLSGALLTLGFLTALVMYGSTSDAWRLALVTLVLTLPIALFVWLAFRPTSPEAFAAAQDILANFRIPHHSRPDLWLDTVANLQIAWIVLAMVLTRGTRLFAVLGVPFLAASLLTLVQILSGSDTLALLFPWRISAILVPLATTVVLSRLATILVPSPLCGGGASCPLPPCGGGLGWGVSFALLFILAGGGLWILLDRQGYHAGIGEQDLYDHVRKHRQPGQLYFLPVNVPTPKPGSLSSDFMPLAQKQLDPRVIPVDLQRFRLATGVPIYVDFKSIPYLDLDVVAWRERIQKVQDIYAMLKRSEVEAAAAGEELKRLRITHLVVKKDKDFATWEKHLKSLNASIDYDDDVYRIYDLPR